VAEVGRLNGDERPLRPPVLRFDEIESQVAWETWRFNCGPSAICALLGLTPAEVRPHLGDFEAKGYTNPTLMLTALRSLRVQMKVRSTPLGGPNEWPRFGLARIQWGGPWTKEGVPIAARYRQTHWVASWRTRELTALNTATPHYVFDVNTVRWGGWRPFSDWRDYVVPWLVREVVPRADGTWWITHSVEILNGGRRG
jgi:hypothetical protein